MAMVWEVAKVAAPSLRRTMTAAVLLSMSSMSRSPSLSTSPTAMPSRVWPGAVLAPPEKAPVPVPPTPAVNWATKARARAPVLLAAAVVVVA